MFGGGGGGGDALFMWVRGRGWGVGENRNDYVWPLWGIDEQTELVKSSENYGCYNHMITHLETSGNDHQTFSDSKSARKVIMFGKIWIKIKVM